MQAGTGAESHRLAAQKNRSASCSGFFVGSKEFTLATKD
jgi:hypothetical protein